MRSWGARRKRKNLHLGSTTSWSLWRKWTRRIKSYPRRKFPTKTGYPISMKCSSNQVWPQEWATTTLEYVSAYLGPNPDRGLASEDKALGMEEKALADIEEKAIEKPNYADLQPYSWWFHLVLDPFEAKAEQELSGQGGEVQDCPQRVWPQPSQIQRHSRVEGQRQ